MILGVLCAGSALSAPVQAWNNFGHMTVAAVAWRQLRPAARARASELLRLNPDYSRWVSGVAPAQRDVIAFLRASTWADAIKHEAGYRDDGERDAGPEASLNGGYEDLREHRYWHYVDAPFSPDGTPLPQTRTPNAATRIAEFRQVLDDPTAAARLKSYDLTWLLHLVGDIHQPLHAVSRFTHELPEGDLGGNRVRVCVAPCREDLHYFWDAALGRGSAVQALALARMLPMPAPADLADDDIQDWLRQSGQIARRVAYGRPVGLGVGPYPLNPAYRARARAVARNQAALAGGRLARLLNAAFAPRGSLAAPPGSGSPP
ncbi:MAG TPA: S1/P1 nuclease [Steroidobacteraceae bacterium]